MSHLLKNQKLISCIVPVYNEEALIEPFIQALHQTLLKTGYAFELVIIDDGSQDHTATIIHRQKEKLPLRYLRFSRNFGKEQAITAGLHHARGDAVILIDSDFQHPLELITRFLDYWEQGFEMVYTIRTNRHDESWLKRFCAQMFYSMNATMNNASIPAHAGDFRLLDRKVVQALQQLPERNRFMKGLYSWVGFKQMAIPFEPQTRHSGTSRWNYSSLFELALTGITSSTLLPLRLIALSGLSITLFTLIYAITQTIKVTWFGSQPAAFTSILLCISFFGGLNLFALGVIGEYIGRIFTETKQRPLYIIDDESSFKE